MNKYVDYLMKGMVENGALDRYDITVDQIKSVRTPFLKGLINRFVRYSLHCRKLRGEFFHVQDHANAHIVNLLPGNARKVLTVHDLYGLRYRDYGLGSNVFSPLVIRGIKRADYLISISEHMKREITERLGYPGERIRAIYHAVDHSLYRPGLDAGEVLAKYGLPESARYVLYVGSEIPRKNFTGVLDVFGKLSAYDESLFLVKIGDSKTPVGRKRALEKISGLGIADRVLFCGFVEEEELPYFYNNAAMLLSPSFYEGDCGLHVLEAMACGCPVVASDIPQVTELVDDSVLLGDPNDVDDIHRKALTLLRDGKAVESFREKGIARASEFTWSRCARENLDVYDEVYGD